MSNVLDRISRVFKPEAPFWACELTSRQAIVAGVNKSRNRVEGSQVVDLVPGSVAGSLAEANLLNRQSVATSVREAMNRAGFQGSEIGVVIPDEAARITFLNADNLPKDHAEQLTFVRWKLKKTVPFDVETSQIALKILGRHAANGAGSKAGVDLLVTLSPRSIIQEYESLMEDLDLHAGYVVPSSLAALNLYAPPAQDAIFVKVAPDCVTTSVFQSRRMTFYRKVTHVPLYDAVYPTILYYQDKLAGTAIQHITLCGFETAGAAEIAELEEKLQLKVQRLGPGNIEDLYKPALGTVHLAWKNLI